MKQITIFSISWNLPGSHLTIKRIDPKGSLHVRHYSGTRHYQRINRLLLHLEEQVEAGEFCLILTMLNWVVIV